MAATAFLPLLNAVDALAAGHDIRPAAVRPAERHRPARSRSWSIWPQSVTSQRAAITTRSAAVQAQLDAHDAAAAAADQGRQPCRPRRRRCSATISSWSPNSASQRPRRTSGPTRSAPRPAVRCSAGSRRRRRSIFRSRSGCPARPGCGRRCAPGRRSSRSPALWAAGAGTAADPVPVRSDRAVARACSSGPTT